MLIAARKNYCNEIVQLEYIATADGHYKTNTGKHTATSRIMVARLCLKQNVGYIGLDPAVAVAHGHYRTMKREWKSKPLNTFFNKLAGTIRKHTVTFLAGDFNMSQTQVVPQ